MASRTPKNGYGFIAKLEDYRIPMWGAVDKWLKFGRRQGRIVALLDSSEALDTLYLLKLGYQPQNIHVVNDVPANVAHVQRKVKAAGYSRVNTYGCDIRTFDTRPLDILSFDGTSNFNASLAIDISLLVRKLRPKIVTYTLMIGREKSYNTACLSETKKLVESYQIYNSLSDSLGKDFSEVAKLRIDTTLEYFGVDLCTSKFTWSTYKSIGSIKMAWFVIHTKYMRI